jgi:hypothetical protein
MRIRPGTTGEKKERISGIFLLESAGVVDHQHLLSWQTGKIFLQFFAPRPGEGDKILISFLPLSKNTEISQICCVETIHTCWTVRKMARSAEPELAYSFGLQGRIIQ